MGKLAKATMQTFMVVMGGTLWRVPLNVRQVVELVAVGLLATVGSSDASAQSSMPGLDKEVQLLTVAPGQTIEFAIEINRGDNRGVALWWHQTGKLFAFWGNQPRKEDKWDDHGGLVDPTIGGQGGKYRWKNDSDKKVLILVNAWKGNEHECSRLKLLDSDEDKGEFTFGGGEDATFNKIALKVKIKN